MLNRENNWIYSIQAQEPGPKVVIMAGVHGNELPGIKAVTELMTKMEIARGELVFIFGNPRAIELAKRQTEANLNRCFGSDTECHIQKVQGAYERKRALEIMEVLDSADSLLDLHSSNNTDTRPFIICEEHSFEVAEQLPHIDIISDGWDAVEPGGSDFYMNKVNRKKGKGVSICVECGYSNANHGVEIAKDIIQKFLELHGLLDAKRGEQKKKEEKLYMHAYEAHIVKEGFRPSCNMPDFQFIQKGHSIGYDGSREILAQENCHILFALENDVVGSEAFVLAKQKR